MLNESALRIITAVAQTDEHHEGKSYGAIHSGPCAALRPALRGDVTGHRAVQHLLMLSTFLHSLLSFFIWNLSPPLEHTYGMYLWNVPMPMEHTSSVPSTINTEICHFLAPAKLYEIRCSGS